MKQLLRTGLLLMSCFLLGCSPKRTVTSLPTPPERLICERSGARPALPPLYQIDWSQVTSVAMARQEHERYAMVVIRREGIVAGYVIAIEGVNFVCFNNMAWRREYEAGIAGQN